MTFRLVKKAVTGDKALEEMLTQLTKNPKESSDLEEYSGED